MGKLTKLQLAILRAIRDRALDTYDIASNLEIGSKTVFFECVKLKARGLVEWMYSEDAVDLSKKGRAALKHQAPE